MSKVKDIDLTKKDEETVTMEELDIYRVSLDVQSVEKDLEYYEVRLALDAIATLSGLRSLSAMAGEGKPSKVAEAADNKIVELIGFIKMKSGEQGEA